VSSTPAPAPAPILDLDAEILDLEVTFNQKQYKLRSRSELSILELRQFSALMKRYDALTDVEDVDEDTATAIGAALQEIAATLVVDPPAGGFPEQQCAAILHFWTEKHREKDPPPARPRRAPQDHKQKTRRSTGAK